MSQGITPKDNQTLSDKVMLRLTALRHVDDPPVIMETHGGVGDVWSAVYNHIEEGVVFEKDPLKAVILARQRPTWAVYETDCVRALSLGVGNHLAVNLVDVDPYGDPWPTLRAFFESERPKVPKLIVVVNDGLRQLVSTGASWRSSSLETAVLKFGNDLWNIYPNEVCPFLMEQIAVTGGYSMNFFDSYVPNTKDKKMVHFIAVLNQKQQTAE